GLQAHFNELESALSSFTEAAELYRRPSANDPDRYGAERAGCLQNVATIQRKLGHPRDALLLLEEAVPLFRRAAKRRPERISDLAICLSNLGGVRHDLREYRSARASLNEAARLLRPLAEQREQHRHALAMVMTNLAAVQEPSDRRAVDLLRESVALNR